MKAQNGIAVIGIALWASQAAALEYRWGEFDIGFTNRITLGAQWRIEAPDPALIAKLNLDPTLCEGDDCISFSGDPAPNQRLVDAPGAFFADKQDDANLNYQQWDLVSGLVKATTDLNVTWRDFTFKARAISFFDAVNYGFDEFNPNNSQDVPEGVGGHQDRFVERDPGTEDLVGASVRLQDLALSGVFFLGPRLLSVGIGSQKVRWGESNLIALNSINEINPPDIRGLRQPGGQINEIFQPVPMVLVSGDVFPDYGITAEAFYQLEWKRVLADAGGSFFGEIDLLYREGPESYAPINLGFFPEDPINPETGRGDHRLQNPLGALLTDTSFSGRFLQREFEPRDDGQYGLRVNWFASGINNGTEFGFYAMNYHSRLPYLSFFATDRTPLRDGPTGTALDVLTSCGLAGNDCFPIDTATGLLDYPEDIQLYGLSFNTNIGSWSVAGEYAYRPNVPVQVSVPDVFFAALQPGLPEEDIIVGAQAIGDFLGSPLGTALNETALSLLDGVLNAATGQLPIIVPGARSAVPDFLETIYRGNTELGNRTDNPYIPGYVRQEVGQLVLNGIRIFGNSNWFASLIRAEQIIMLLEAGVTHMIDLPPMELVQFDGSSPNRTHFSPGADGTGDPEGETNPSSLNPTQQTTAFTTEFSWGYRALAQFEYNDVFLGVNLKPFIIIAHDVEGYGPSPQQNFLEGRKEWLVGTEWFKGQRISGKLQYNGHAGSRHNVRRDKDNVLVELSYTF